MYITFGVKERFDIKNWTLYLADRFGPDHRIVLSGLSMGSTSVLMALGTELPDNVKCAIADCGFTSPYDQFVHMFRDRFHLPVHPFMDMAQIFAGAFAGFGFRDYSTLTALAQNNRPILFVHGERDTFVLPRFTRENYAACKAEKVLITVPDAGHGASYLFDTQGCQEALQDFLARYAN